MFSTLNGSRWSSPLLLIVISHQTQAQTQTQAPTTISSPAPSIDSVQTSPPNTKSPTIAPSTRFPTLVPTTKPSTLVLIIPPTIAPTIPTIVPTVTPTETYTYAPFTYPPYRTRTPTYYFYPSNPSYTSYTYYPSYPSYPYYPSDILVNDSTGQNAQVSAYVVGSLVIITLGILYCSKSRFQNNSFSDENVTTFHKDILKNKYLIVHWPKNLTIEKKNDKRAVLFFTTRIKALWVRPLAQLQFVLGWVTFFTTIIGFANPSNRVNSNIGSAALFLGELVTHLWHGYFRYWNPSWWCLGIDSKHKSVVYFTTARERCTRLYHGGKRNPEKELSSTSDDTEIECEPEQKLNNDDKKKEEHELPKWIEYLGFVVCAPLHIGSILGSGLGFGLSLVLTCCTRDKNTDHAPVVGVVSALMGCLAYPILFNLQTNGAGLKILAIVLHHTCIEYYEAKLFCKTDRNFFLSLTCKAFSDFFLEEVELPNIELDNKILDEKNIDEESPLQTKKHEDASDSDNHVNENLNLHESGDTEHTDTNQSDGADDENHNRDIDIDVKENWYEFAYDSNDEQKSTADRKNDEDFTNQCNNVVDETELQEEFEVDWEEENDFTKVVIVAVADPENTSEIIINDDSTLNVCVVIDEKQDDGQVPTADEQEEEEDEEHEIDNSHDDDDDDDEDEEKLATNKEVTTKIIVVKNKFEQY